VQESENSQSTPFFGVSGNPHSEIPEISLYGGSRGDLFRFHFRDNQINYFFLLDDQVFDVIWL